MSSNQQTRATCDCTAALVKVRERGFGLLQTRINAVPVCDDSASEDKTRKCGAI